MYAVDSRGGEDIFASYWIYHLNPKGEATYHREGRVSNGEEQDIWEETNVYDANNHLIGTKTRYHE